VSLAPAESALLADARAEAERVVGDAEQTSRSLVEGARTQAQRSVAVARAEGEALAEREAAHRIALAQIEARASLLQVQREQYELLRRQVLAAVDSIRGTARYERLLARLERLAREQLGTGAEVVVDPPEGGVIATSGRRRVDYTLPALAERCLERHSAEVQALWQ
jgi:vacuolar-type H+-ATPase subunit E/Vma4